MADKTKTRVTEPVPRDPVERYLRDALKQYPKMNPQRTQAAKICEGVLALAREMEWDATEKSP